MTLQALDNFKKEIGKARARIEEVNRNNEAILARLENDLDAVREFAEEDSGKESIIETVYRLGYEAGFKAGSDAEEERIFDQ